jgi:hypothetical protein
MSTSWPTAHERATTWDWTRRVPRPRAADGTSPEVLRVRQSQWDEAESKRQRIAALRDQARVAREAKGREAAEARQQAREQAKRAALTHELRIGYFSVPGAIEERFQAALPKLLEARRRQAALAMNDAARQAETRRYQDFFRTPADVAP